MKPILLGLLAVVTFQTDALAQGRQCSDEARAGHAWLFGTLGQAVVNFPIPFCTDPVIIVSAEAQSRRSVVLNIDGQNRTFFRVMGCMADAINPPWTCAAPAPNTVKVHWIATRKTSASRSRQKAK